MNDITSTVVGSVQAIWRYPVKSMQGESLQCVEVAQSGLRGDRCLALVDATTGKIASAKNPRKWGKLFQLRAAFTDRVAAGPPFPPVEITLPDGATVRSDQAEAEPLLSDLLERPVQFETQVRAEPILEACWPDIDHFEKRGTVTDEMIRPHSFFDGEPVHLVTTASLTHLSRLYPGGQFQPQRFRPNFLIATPPEVSGFAEDDWMERVVAVGDHVRLLIKRPCPRCIMTTIPVGDLPPDTDILRTIVKHHGGNLGAYVTVRQGGVVRVGDPVRLES